MAITATALTGNSDETDLTVYTTASIAPTADNLVLMLIGGQAGGGSTITSVVGNGLTYTLIDSVELATNRKIYLYRAMASSPSSGTVVITFAQEQVRATWSIAEFANVDTSGTHGSGAIVQNVNAGGTGTAALVTLASFSSAANATYGSFVGDMVAGTWSSEGTGFTALHFDLGNGDIASLTEWRNDNDTTVTATADTSRPWHGIAVEIKAAATTISGAHGKMGFMF